MTKKSAEQPERSEAVKQWLGARDEREASEGRAAEQNTSPYPTNVGPNGVVKHCDLCEAARFTHWYHEDDVCWTADCEVCSVPMVVWKPHGTEPTDPEVEHMLEQLQAAGETRFGDEAFTLDREMRTIPDHWHAHARDSDWLRLRMQRPLSRYTAVGAERVER